MSVFRFLAFCTFTKPSVNCGDSDKLLNTELCPTGTLNWVFNATVKGYMPLVLFKEMYVSSMKSLPLM